MAKAVASSTRKKTPLKAKVATKKPQPSKKKKQMPSQSAASEARSQLAAPEERERMIQYAAYHIAEKDGFKSGKETEYWLQAEQQISDLLRGQPTSGASDIH